MIGVDFFEHKLVEHEALPVSGLGTLRYRGGNSV